MSELEKQQCKHPKFGEFLSKETLCCNKCQGDNKQSWIYQNGRTYYCPDCGDAYALSKYELTQQVICPHCDHELNAEDFIEWSEPHLEGEEVDDCQCPFCEQFFSLVIEFETWEVQRTYSTRKGA